MSDTLKSDNLNEIANQQLIWMELIREAETIHRILSQVLEKAQE